MSNRKRTPSYRARRAAQCTWGEINEQRKVTHDVFWFSGVRHGGFILLVPNESLDTFKWMEQLNVMCWGLDGINAVAFEKECDWGLLNVHRPDVAVAALDKGVLVSSTLDNLLAHAHHMANKYRPDLYKYASGGVEIA